MNGDIMFPYTKDFWDMAIFCGYKDKAPATWDVHYYTLESWNIYMVYLYSVHAFITLDSSETDSQRKLKSR